MADIYPQIKLIEANFPIPAPSAKVTVGTLDAVSGKFTGLRSTRVRRSEPGPLGKPMFFWDMVPPTVQVNAVDVDLVFQVQNRSSDFSATVNGTTVSAPANQNVLQVRTRDSTITWSVTSGGHTVSDSLELQRPPIVGAGAFRVPALPFVVVYDPPQGKDRLNTATMTKTTSVGTTIKMSFSTEHTVDASFISLSDFVSKTGTVISDLSSAVQLFSPSSTIGGQLTSIIDGMKAISDLLGTASSSKTDATVTTHGTTLEILGTKEEVFATQAHLGPGVGDVIGYLRNAQLVWLADVTNGTVSLALLTWDAMALASAQTLQQWQQQIGTGGTGTVNGLTGDSIAALLALDPFVSGQSLVGNPRYVGPDQDSGLPTIELYGPGPSYQLTISHQVTTTDTQESETSHTDTQELQPGWIQILVGGANPANTKIDTRVTQSSSSDKTQGQQVSASVSLSAGAGDAYGVTVYYDRIFGSFAFASVPLQSQPTIAGSAYTAQKQPLANQVVTLQTPGGRFITMTDSQGRYGFHAATLKPGPLAMNVGRANRQATFTGQPLAGLDLQE